MITAPCNDYVPCWNRPKEESWDVKENHNWGTWVTIKEESCHSKDGFQTNLQERECKRCGLLQQRRVHV